MRWFLGVTTAALVITVMGETNRADDQREAKLRFKGVELYSWKDKGGDWEFVLLDGTNRLKTEDEVRSAKDRARGVEALRKTLSRLAIGEQILWTHPIVGFEFPPASIVKEIKKAAEDVKVELHVPHY
jgi:hypothetical protein